MEEKLYWLHADLPRLDIAAAVGDMVARLRKQTEELKSLMSPRFVQHEGTVVAGCYFKPLGGSVATLGKLRAAEGWETSAATLVNDQAAELRKHGLSQVQAVVPESDHATAKLLNRAGWTFLTHVQHQWLDRLPADTPQSTAPVQAEPLSWRPANHLAQSRFARLIEGTFEQTLDCPALNGLRNSSQVLEGFLEGRSWRSLDCSWELLEYRGELAGCLLTQMHGKELLELSYLGLLPAARGQRLGQQLVRRAQQHCQRRGAQALVAAVDEKNWPALRLYRQLGFEPQQRFEIWLYENCQETRKLLGERKGLN